MRSFVFKYFSILLLAVFSSHLSVALNLTAISQAPTEDQSSAPEIIYAQPSDEDPYFPYQARPLRNSAKATTAYPKYILDNLQKLTHLMSDFVPWSFKGEPGDKGLYKLRDIIADKIVVQGQVYNVMYHGTTSDLLDVFKKGASAIRFDVATHVVLGMGFYLSASINEAKAYACERMRERSRINKDIQAMLLVVGVLDNDIIKGKTSPDFQLSNDQTGEPLDPEIFFKRKTALSLNDIDNRYNQFSFFTNVAPYLKILKIVLLPRGFGRTSWVQDFDGQADVPTALYKTNPAFKCF